MKTKIIRLFIAVCCVLCTAVFPCHAHAAPGVSARSAVLMDADSRLFLYEKDADARLGMASTTKIMTALTARRLTRLDNTVIIPKEAVGIEGSSVYLCEGERLTVEQLLYAVILASANDASVALAIYCSGSVERFADEMNAYAAELGLKNTHFSNPHGLDDDAHYTTARELALVASEALRDDCLARIFATKKATIPFCDDPDGRLLVNHNKLLSTYEGAIGVKTGYTKSTGRCLVSAAKQDGMTLIAVTLDAPDDWSDHSRMLDFGFSGFERRILAEAGEYIYRLSVTGGTGETVTLTNTLPLILTLPRSHVGVEYAVCSTSHFLFAPIMRGDTAAEVTVKAYGQTVSSPLVATQSIDSAREKASPLQKFFDIFKKD